MESTSIPIKEEPPPGSSGGDGVGIRTGYIDTAGYGDDAGSGIYGDAIGWVSPYIFSVIYTLFQ